MPAPKNNSLGRGLGDLLGGVPETIGVARQVPTPPGAEPVPAAVPDPAVSAPSEPPAPAQAAPESITETTTPSRWATPRHLLLMGACLLPVLLGGFAMGYFIGRPRLAPVAATPPVAVAPRVVVVTNTVRIAPVPAIRQPAVETGEFKALEGEGLVTEVARDNTVRLIFEAPLFSTRLVLDPEQVGLLGKVGGILARHAGQWDVRITGHADATPLRNGGACRDNYELALARAAEVMRYFWRHERVPMTMMHAASYGDEKPPFPGEDEDSRRLNRTVTISIRTAPGLPPGE